MDDGVQEAPALWVLTGVSRVGRLCLLVVNADPVRAVTSSVLLEGLRHSSWLKALVLDGPGATAYNTPLHPREVTTTVIKKDVGVGGFRWTFPAHSVTVLRLSVTSGGG